MYSNILLSFYFLFILPFLFPCSHLLSAQVLWMMCSVLKSLGICVPMDIYSALQHCHTGFREKKKNNTKTHYFVSEVQVMHYARIQISGMTSLMWGWKYEMEGESRKGTQKRQWQNKKLFSSPSSAYEYLPLGSKGYWAITIWTNWSQEFFAASKLSDRSCISWTLWYLEIYREDLATASNNCKRNSILAEGGNLLCDLVIAGMLKWLTNDALHRCLLNDSGVK